MKPTHLRTRHYLAHLGRLHPTRIGAVVVQRPVGSRVVIVRGVASKNPHEVSFAENDALVLFQNPAEVTGSERT